MTSTLKNILQELYNLQQKTTGCVSPVDYVFVNPENGRRITAPGSRFRKLLKRARIKDFRFHDMRHNFASYLAMNNVDIRTIQELLGHKDIKMTIRYSHLSSRALEQAVRKFNDYVEEKLDASENKEEEEESEDSEGEDGGQQGSGTNSCKPSTEYATLIQKQEVKK